MVVSLYLRRKIQLSPCPYGSHIPFPGLYMSPLCLWTLEAAQVFSPSPSTHLLICSTLKPRAIFHQGFPELHCLTSFIFQNSHCVLLDILILVCQYRLSISKWSYTPRLSDNTKRIGEKGRTHYAKYEQGTDYFGYLAILLSSVGIL